ncbi:MAG: hypothetical protein D6820_06030, partial [Lentisphaerae bacterium]
MNERPPLSRTHCEAGFSLMVFIALILISAIVAALIGILSSSFRSSLYRFRSYSSEQKCRMSLLETVGPILEERGWPRMAIEPWMEPCDEPEQCFGKARAISTSHGTIRLRAVPLMNGTYIIT